MGEKDPTLANLCYPTSVMAARAKLLAWAIPAILAVVILALWGLREPRYDGRSLSEWLGDAPRASFRSTADYLRARDEAIRAMGKRAVPRLVQMLSARETTLQEIFRAVRNNLFRSGVPSHWELRSRATIGLQILGPAAASAVPEIVRLLEREPERLELWYILQEIGGPSAGAAPLLERTFSKMKKGAGARNGDFQPEWLISDLYMCWGTAFRDVLRREFMSENNSILQRITCLWALRRDSEHARSFIPAVLAILNDPSESALLKTACLHALGRIPALDTILIEKALLNYETAYGRLPSHSIMNGNFGESGWLETDEPPVAVPAPSSLVRSWLTWNGVVGRNLPASGTLKLELGPRTPPGAISQVFRTTPGASYILRFEAATGRNARIEITAGTLSTNCIAESSDLTKPTLCSFEFAAVSPLTTVTFSTPEVQGYGPFIDNVFVSLRP